MPELLRRKAGDMANVLILVALVADLFFLVSSTVHSPAKCPANEVYDRCIGLCPASRYDFDDHWIKFDKPPGVGDLRCVPGCRCADGFYRNSWGVCAPKTNHPRCDGPNEYYACAGACDNVCETLHIQNQTNCPIINIRCNDMCYCYEGYARNRNNICIPIEKCPAPTCGINEVYSNCVQSTCSPQHCTQLGFPVPCPKIDPKHCKKGCICKEGYARNWKGICVPTNQCPSCGGDPNAIPGCGKNCGRLCSNYNSKKPVHCTKECNLNGCDCKPGYVYDTNKKKCVLPKDCTPTCGKHEVNSDCMHSKCGPRNCTHHVGFPFGCLRFCPFVH